MANKAGKNIVFEDLISRGENPAGLSVHAPAGTIYPTKDGVSGGDGCQFNWGNNADSDRWNRNPMDCTHQMGDLIPSALPLSRKLKK
jgi:hypothetical protein